MSEKSVSEYIAEKEQAARPKRVAEMSELEQAQLGPAAIRALLDSEAAHDAIAAKHAEAAASAAKARAALDQLPSWVAPKALGQDHRGQRVEVEADHPPLPLADGRVLLRLTRRKPQQSSNMVGNIGPALAKLGADAQTLAPAEARWLACGGLLRVPANKAIVVWALHRPAKVALTDPDLSRGFVLDSPRQYGAGYEGEILINFPNTPEQILQLSPGHFIGLAELVES